MKYIILIIFAFFIGLLIYKFIRLGWIKIKEKIFWEFPIFLKYIITEPFVQLFYFLKWFGRKGEKLEKLNVFLYINMYLIVIFLVLDNRLLLKTFGIIYILVLLKWQWDQKEYIRKYRAEKGEYFRRGFVKKILEEKRKN